MPSGRRPTRCALRPAAADRPGQAARALENGRHTGAVRMDQREAETLGIHGVPAMLIVRAGAPVSQSLLVSGAQPFEAVRAAIDSLRTG
jgi:predicted DsbA family dithiol-disulfide isomerase